MVRTSGRKGNTNRARQRGQALMIAVLVLFAVATLAALFAAIISSQLAQVGRHTDVVALRNVTEAGLRFANEQLSYSIEGADWRPAQPTYRIGAGEATIQVSYGPAPGQLQSRFIRIVVSSVLRDNPFLRHTLVALKPVLLTDYVRFVTDRFQSQQPAYLGAAPMEFGGAVRSSANGGDYVFRVAGPIRSNTDLYWFGPSRVDLYTQAPEAADTWATTNLLRDDRIEVAGGFYPANPLLTTGPILNLVVNNLTRANDLFRPQAGMEQSYVAGYPDAWWGPVAATNTWRVLANLPEYTIVGATSPLEPQQLAVPRIQPPAMDAVHPDSQVNRYLALTRDSGSWLPVSALTGEYVNSGAFGWGWTQHGGIYIDNTSDIQYQHDLEALRLNWAGSVGVHQTGGDLRATGTEGPPTGPADWWDKTGRYYTPPGVEIILHGDNPKCPYVEIIRHDLRTAASGVNYYWQMPSGEPIAADQSWPYPLSGPCKPIGTEPAGVFGNVARFPFPPNGVIYAEGNVRIRGIMPPARSGPLETAPPSQYFGAYDPTLGRARRFDLQVVSGGSIYVEGDLLTPCCRGAKLLEDASKHADPSRHDAEWGSRIALIARDSVCVNTTALQPRPRLMTPDKVGTDEQVYNDDQTTYPDEATARTPRHWQWMFRGPADQVPSDDFDEPAQYDTVPPALDFIYTNVRLQNTKLRAQLADLRLVLGHSAWYAMGGLEDKRDPGEPPEQAADNENPVDVVGVHVGVAVTGAEDDPEAPNYLWAHDTDRYSFLRAAEADPENSDQSAHWYTLDDPLEMLPNEYQAMPIKDSLTGNDLIRFMCSVSPRRFVQFDPDTGAITALDWEIAPDELAYVLGPVVVMPPRDRSPLPVQIQALVYAQNGCWYVLPGPWFNEDPRYNDYARDYPGYHEPLNIQISFFGAISENLPASPGEVADWTSKWGGMAGRAVGCLTYEYDPVLRYHRWRPDPLDGDLVRVPRIPALPLTTDLVMWGERVSGQTGS